MTKNSRASRTAILREKRRILRRFFPANGNRDKKRSSVVLPRQISRARRRLPVYLRDFANADTTPRADGEERYLLYPYSRMRRVIGPVRTAATESRRVSPRFLSVFAPSVSPPPLIPLLACSGARKLRARSIVDCSRNARAHTHSRPHTHRRVFTRSLARGK